MKPFRAIRRTARRLVQAWKVALFGEPGPPVIRHSVARTRKLQKRAAQLAYRHPFTPPHQPRVARGAEDRGFQ